MFKKIVNFCFDHAKLVLVLTAVAIVAALVQIPKIKVDTDPENMLPNDEPVRVFHDRLKQEFNIYDFIVLGVINPEDENGVFNAETLNNVYQITQEVKNIDGVISEEIIAPSTKDNIRQGGVGEVVFEWLMPEPIQQGQQALSIRGEALDNPMFYDTMVSRDGKALAVYIPIEKKDISYKVSQQIEEIISKYKGQEEYHITGLPVAEDTFGVQMFKQMAISAPLAGLIIFLLMLLFFKNIRLVISPMLLAITTVVLTMGLLIGLGFGVHIMSSMIPIFLMPIAVLDSVHILSEFFDKYKYLKDKRKTVFAVIDELFKPMLFTSLTSAVGFFSLSFSPIPPVQTFGVFVAIGILIAWFLTMTFIPAYISLIKDKSLDNMHAGRQAKPTKETPLDRLLQKIKTVSINYAKPVVILSIILVILSVYGISRIQVNDNPIRWFEPNHKIRVADRILNDHFGGTYTAYLVLESDNNNQDLFKRPQMLRYIEGLTDYLEDKGQVGKATSLADVVKKVYYELLGDKQKYNRIPDSKQAVSQSLISFQNSHKPGDLWHMTTPDYSKVNIWLQLTSGDNKQMSKVIEQVDRYFKQNPPPFKISYNWGGLTYINVVWQNKMVGGMLKNFLASFIIVFFMMTFLFRSPLRGLVSMIPLTITILFIYSLLGFIGKDYDMPVAVLSALTLGLSVDFAIHFIQRAREIFNREKEWLKTASLLFKGPARAIARNALVVAIGFLPLLVAPLVPYKTVGFFMFAIMFVSSVVTLFMLPAIITLKPNIVFQESSQKMICHCKYCMIIATALSVSIIYLLRGYTQVEWGPVILISIVIIALAAGLCSFLSQHKFCLLENNDNQEG
jgi:hypothetical protein